jgi:hypothetical protein
VHTRCVHTDTRFVLRASECPTDQPRGLHSGSSDLLNAAGGCVDLDGLWGYIGEGHALVDTLRMVMAGAGEAQ